MSTHRHPKGLPVLFFTEMWERFSFYCMLAILALYMKASPEEGGLGFSIFKTGQIFGLYTGIVYFTPLLGGMIADRWFGIRRTIVAGGLFMMAGHFLLAFRPLPFFFGGLTCMVIGNGLFKPNISTLLGNLYRESPEKRDDGYNIFYMGINLGAFISPLVAAGLRSLDVMHGWHYAFASAGVGMIFSMIIFLSFQKHVRAGDLRTSESADMIREIPLTPTQTRRRIQALLIIFAVVIFFWMAFDQNGLTLTYWAENATITTWNPEIFQSANPLFILAFTPLIVIFWNFMRSRRKEPSTASKLGLGMLLTAVAYLIMAFAGLAGGDTGKVSMAWLISSYAVITLGELCLSPMGLSLVSKLAPARNRGLLMGGWFTASAIGNYLAGLTGAFWDQMPHSTFFFILVGTSVFAFFILAGLLRFLNPVIQEAEEMAREAADAA